MEPLDGLLLPGAGESKTTVGGTVSRVQVVVAGVGSTLPATSTAATEKVWVPSARAPVLKGLVQVVTGPPSREHRNDATPLVASLPLKAIDSVARFVSAGGGEVMAVVGGVWSMWRVT